MFSAGDTAVPAEGMQQIPLQLAAKLPAGTLMTEARVGKVTRNTEFFAIEIEASENLEARAVMTAVSAGYAPPGAHLVVASVVGEAPQENAALLRLNDGVRTHLGKWFGPAVDSWKMLRAYPLSPALPQQRHAEWEQVPVRVGGSGGVYMCGDYRETASIQGALASGRRAAEAVLHDLTAREMVRLLT
jgi:hypothetical protein